MNRRTKKTTPVGSTARFEAIRLLNQFHDTLMPLNLIFEHHFAGNQFKRQARNLVSELVYGTVRWQIQLDWILEQFVHGDFSELPVQIKNILRCGLYQLRFLKKLPDYAVLNESVQLTRAFHQIKYSRLVNGVLRNYLRFGKKLFFPTSEDDPVQYLKVNTSFPDWMIKLLLEQYDFSKLESIFRCSNHRPGLTIRVNTTKIFVSEFLTLLHQQQIETEQSELFPEFICLHGSRTVTDLPGYWDGYFSVQNESSGIVSHLMASEIFENKIVDLCAAPGGKLSHLAELSRDEKAIFGVDLSRPRLRMTQTNLQRLGLRSVHLIQADSSKLPFSGLNVIVLDAPCSGLGVIRKNPDIKIRRKPEDLEHARELQLTLLEEAASLLNRNGVLIYSTCSINKDENENLILYFLNSHPEFFIENASNIVKNSVISKQGWIKTTPDMKNLDGSFSVRLRKGNKC